MTVILTVVLLASLAAPGVAFNIDPSEAIFLSGPAGSYFGFSLVLHSNSDGNWLLVGAPKGESIHQPSLMSPGAVYQCPLQRGSNCTQIKLDDKGNENVSRILRDRKYPIRIKYVDRKEDQWLGASLDAHQHGDGAVVACAPRWADMRYRSDGHVMGNGGCYVINGDLEFNSTRRHLTLTRRNYQIHHALLENLFAYGQMGMAAQYTEDGEKLLVGAPGVRDWTGSVVEFTDHSEYVAIPDRRAIAKNGYVGYALTSGQFFGPDVTYYVAGAPRLDLHGRVLVYTGRFSIKTEFSGVQVGEYFGAALCAADINRDGLDDLLVGAPLYKSRRYEEGRVAVYIMRQTHVFEHVVDLLGSSQPGARFGSALSAADINLDNYPDVLIGAPYEDNGYGAVYIYNGYHGGLHVRPSQRLPAASLHPDLRGFGYALARPVRRPGEQYPDVAVGAYGANMAVLLPLRPVIVLRMNASTYPRLLDPEVANCHLNNGTSAPRSCNAIGVVFRYHGVGLPERLSFRVTVRADITRHEGPKQLPVRGSFKNGTLKQLRFTHETSTEMTTLVEDWPADTRWQDHFILVLSKHVRDIITPLSVSVDIELLPPTNTTGLQPMIDQYCRQQMVLEVPFDKSCGPDNHCHTDLQLRASVKWPQSRDYIILGQTEPITIEILLNNVEEKAYMTTVTILHPPDLSYHGIRARTATAASLVSCTPHTDDDYIEEHGSAAVVCDFGNPLPEHQLRSVNAVFWMPTGSQGNVYLGQQEVVLSVMAATRSNETYTENNNKVLHLPVKVDARLDLSGVSQPEQHVYELPTDNVTQTFSNETEWENVVDKEEDEVSGTEELTEPEVDHIYDLRNDGPGLFPGGHVQILVPVAGADGRPILEYSVIVRSDLPDSAEVPLDGSEVSRKRRAANTSEDGFTSDEEDRTVPALPLLGHSRAGPLDVFCGNARCVVSSHTLAPMKAGESVMISVHLKFYMENLTSLHMSGSVNLITRLQVFSLGHTSDKPLADLQVSTLVTPRHAGKVDTAVPWWVVAASIGVGLLLLLVVILVLCKCGFFTRTEREELAKLIGQNETNEQHETRMRGGAEGGDEWQLYDPWQPQTGDTTLLIWHANGSISHSSREEYTAATRRSSSSTHDRNRNEKGRQVAGDSIRRDQMPSTSGSSGGSGGDRRDLTSSLTRSVTSRDDDVFVDGQQRSPWPQPPYLLIRGAEDSDDELEENDCGPSLYIPRANPERVALR